MDPTPLKLRRAGKTDIPGPLRRSFSEASTFNAGATLGPVNPVRSKTLKMSADVQARRTSNGVNETNMARIRNKPQIVEQSSLRGRHKQSNTPLKRKVFVGMSGGVDSSVTAALLKQATPNNFEKLFGHPTPKGFRGFDVRGVHIKMWSPMESRTDSTGQADPFFAVCKQQNQDRIDATRVAAHLNIPFETWDFSKEYKKEVVEYMIREYAKGRTPNPDVMCNRHIKFGIFLKRALKEGADFVATGHYARNASVADSRRLNADRRRRFILMQANDKNKDQSYFIWTLTQKQLRHVLFPIGEYTKPEVRKMAKKYGLSTAEKKDSQGICFIGEIDLREFLKRHIPAKRGSVVTTSGKKIGEHEGLFSYTLGQRQGIGIGGGIPFYVVAKDYKTNTLIVAEGPFDEKLFRQELKARDLNWISGDAPRFPYKCEARIRYRQPLQFCRIAEITSNRLLVTFAEPQRAVTPGQSIVFYKNGEMLGGGIIM